MNFLNYKKESLLWLILLVPFIYLAWVWNTLPDRVPIHFDINGNVNGWGGRDTELIP